MKPLKDLGAEACRSLVGVAFDIDDTVTRDGRLELVAFQAMHDLAESGLRLVAVTGRPLGWVDVIAQHWPVDVAIGENGAGWAWLDGHIPREGYYEPKEQRDERTQLFERLRERVGQGLPHIRTSIDQRARRCDLAFDIGETVQIPREEVEKLAAIIEGEGVRCAVSSVHAHAVPGDWNKAQGIKRAVLEATGVDVESERDRWLFIGDSTNDWSAFDYFPISVGVANVRDFLSRLKATPKFATREDRGAGFAEMAKHVLAAR
jgi:HAD superfamily hydrolase (TIGR01484 family)